MIPDPCTTVAFTGHRTYCGEASAALAAAIRDFSEAELQAVGAGAVNQSVKAIAIASGFLAPSGMLLFAQPSFEAIEIDGEERTAIRFKVTSQKI